MRNPFSRRQQVKVEGGNAQAGSSTFPVAQPAPYEQPLPSPRAAPLVATVGPSRLRSAIRSQTCPPGVPISTPMPAPTMQRSQTCPAVVIERIASRPASPVATPETGSETSCAAPRPLTYAPILISAPTLLSPASIASFGSLSGSSFSGSPMSSPSFIDFQSSGHRASLGSLFETEPEDTSSSSLRRPARSSDSQAQDIFDSNFDFGVSFESEDKENVRNARQAPISSNKHGLRSSDPMSPRLSNKRPAPLTLRGPAPSCSTSSVQILTSPRRATITHDGSPSARRQFGSVISICQTSSPTFSRLHRAESASSPNIIRNYRNSPRRLSVVSESPRAFELAMHSLRDSSMCAP